MLQVTKRLKHKLNALKHGVFAKGIAPWEDSKKFEALRQKWRNYFDPSDPLLEAALEEIVMVDWQRERNRNSMVLYALCEPFGQVVAQYRGQMWTDVANKLLSERDQELSRLINAIEHLANSCDQIADPKYSKRLVKATDTMRRDFRRLVNQHQISREFFMGIGAENAKQAERAVELNAHFQKLYTLYIQLAQYVDSQKKLKPARIEHSKSTADDTFDDVEFEEIDPKTTSHSSSIVDQPKH